MKRNMVTIFVALVLLALGQYGPASAAEESASGFILVSPARATNCVAVRVDVPADMALSGVRWFNGSAVLGFDRVLIASGSDVLPPVIGEALVVAEETSGPENGWAELAFTEPIASLSGTLFVVLQYPANYEPSEGEVPAGVGYSLEPTDAHYFVSGDGDNWRKVSKSCKLLLEPVYVSREPGMLEKSAGRDTEDAEEPPRPTVLSLNSYPNPFNPEVQIAFDMPSTADASIRIYNLQGRLVRTIFRGVASPGRMVFPWRGRDNQGRAVGSGVYFALLETGGKTLTNRLVLIK